MHANVWGEGAAQAYLPSSGLAMRLFSHRSMGAILRCLTKAGQQSASFYGRGLCGWKYEKRVLEGRLDYLAVEGQRTLPL